MRDTPERDLAVAQELGSMANARIKELEAEVVQLRNWKESAMSLLTSYDTIAESFGGKLGSSKVQNLERGVAELRETLKTLRHHLQKQPDVVRLIDDVLLGKEQVTG